MAPPVNVFRDGILSKPCKFCRCNITQENCVVTSRCTILAICKPCYLEKARERNKNRYKNMNNTDGNRQYRLGMYNLSLEKYREMLIAQKGVCAICKGINKDGRPLFVDHDHVTNENRGLLCYRCNIVLGHCQDDKNLMMEMVSYIIKYSDIGSVVNG